MHLAWEPVSQYYNTRYIRLLDLLIGLEMARVDGTYRKVMAKYANLLVLILDEWLLLKPTEVEQKDILSLCIEDVRNHPRSFAYRMVLKSGMIGLAEMPVL